MKPRTAELWSKQDQHTGDRWRLFSAVAKAVDAQTVLYPGCYVDIAPSFVFDSVTYIDIDKRAAKFFADEEGVREIVAEHGGPVRPKISFIHTDYTSELGLPTENFDLLVSLYAGFISAHCTQHLIVGGTLLVNPSHGDAAMASIDQRYELSGVVISQDGDYRVSTVNLETYLVPKKEQEITVDSLHKSGRGVRYTKSPFAYVFKKVR